MIKTQPCCGEDVLASTIDELILLIREDRLEEGAEFDQMRMFKRSLECYCTDNISLPTLVYHNGWTGNFPRASRVVLELLDKAKSLHDGA